MPRVARLMIHTPTAISIFVCLSMVQLMAVFISMRCSLCGHFLQVALTLILVVGYAIAASKIAFKIRDLMVTVCPSQFATRRTLFHILGGCGLLMLKVSRLKFFFQAEDGIRYLYVTGVQTCALPILALDRRRPLPSSGLRFRQLFANKCTHDGHAT